MPHEEHDVPYTSMDDAPGLTTREGVVRRVTRAVFEVWRTWAENRGHLTLPWDENAQRTSLFDRVRDYTNGGDWSPFPNASWVDETCLSSEKREDGSPVFSVVSKSPELIADQKAGQDLFEAVAKCLLLGIPAE